MKKVALVASAALAASSVFLVVQPASSALVTRCTGDGGAVTVPNNLIVPAGKSCTLTGTTVLGNITVREGADLLMDGVTVSGDVVVRNNGYADVLSSSVGGAVKGRDQFGVFLEDSSVAGMIDQRNPNATEFAPFVYTFGTDVEGGVTARAGELLLESSRVSGDVLSRDGEYADVIDSTLGGDLTVRNDAFGSVVCESEIYGDALYADNSETLQIGGAGEVGPCDGASFWGGDVTFNNNTATTFDISNNIVAGDLMGSGNDPMPTGAGNRVRGEITLAFADPEMGEMSLQSQSRMSVENQKSAGSVVQSRVAELQAKIDARTNKAEKVAATTPDNQALVLGNS